MSNRHRGGNARNGVSQFSSGYLIGKSFVFFFCFYLDTHSYQHCFFLWLENLLRFDLQVYYSIAVEIHASNMYSKYFDSEITSVNIRPHSAIFIKEIMEFLRS